MPRDPNNPPAGLATIVSSFAIDKDGSVSRFFIDDHYGEFLPKNRVRIRGPSDVCNVWNAFC
jgi:hypothetical protein